MNPTILKNIPPDSPKSQHRSRIMEVIANANPNLKKIEDTPTNLKWPIESMFAYADPKSNTYGAPVSQEDFAFGRSVAADIQAELQAARELQAASNTPTGGTQLLNNNMDPNEQRFLNAGVPQPNTSSADSTPNTLATPADGNLPQGSQHPGSTTYAPNHTVSAKTDDNQNNSIAALLNNNPGYLTPTAIGQTLIAALLGRLIGGNTGMSLGAIMGLLASPLTASYLARNNYLSDIAKPFAETEKGWFNPNKPA